MKLKIIIPIIVLAIIGGFIALRSTTPKPKPNAMDMTTMPSTSMAPQAENAVSIQNYKFNPTPLKVKKGTTVTWTNMDIAKHTITVDSGQPAGGPDGPLFGKGETYSFTFMAAGTYHYHCDPHPYMHGVVEVTE